MESDREAGAERETEKGRGDAEEESGRDRQITRKGYVATKYSRDGS